MSNYVIVGNGIAAVSAAKKIKEKEPAAHIDIVTSESHAFYGRPMLPKVISGEFKEEAILVYGADWYRKNGISLVTNEEVVEIDPMKREARSAGGHSYRFDRLLIATGGRCFVPPFKGTESPGIFTLHSLSDARRIAEQAGKSRTAVIIGAGVLGLEVAAALTRFGIKVTLIEAAPRMLPRQLDSAGAEILKRQLEAKMGFTFYINSQVEEIAGSGYAREVALAGGARIQADMVLVSAGIRPDLELPRKAGLKVNKGIVVDDRMETSARGIFAAGDVAEHKGIIYGIIPAAQRQGEVAGINMAGGDETYQGTTPVNTVSVLGMSLFSIGDIDPDGKYPSLTYVSKTTNIYRKLVLQGDSIIGCILLNDSRGSTEIMQAIQNKKNIALLKDRLLDIDFDYKLLAS